jgi:hypothetical protein
VSNSENFTSDAARWSATHGKGVVRGWLAFVLVVACSPRWLTRQAALLPGGSCARVLGLAASVGASAKTRSRHRARGGVHRLRVLCGLAPLACGVLLMLAALPPEALASTNSATGVEASLPANAGTNPHAGLGSVSCASAGNCSAVGGYTDSSGHRQGLLLTETSGTWATGVEASLPANAGTNPEVSLTISCGSAGNCTAVGSYFVSYGDFQGLLLTETSGTWATGVEASLPANANTSSVTSLDSVSCASAGNCSAVGSYTDSSGHSQGLLLSETSGTWATGVEASLPANAGTNPNVIVNSVSCVSAGNCTAVGAYDDTSGGTLLQDQGLLLSETSGTWAAGVEASLPAGVGTTPYVYLDSVSCASAGNCTAVGFVQDSYDADSSLTYHGLLLSETSGTWVAAVEPSLPAGACASASCGAGLASVSCGSAGSCTAVGSYIDSSGQSQGLLLFSETSGTWATGVEPSLPANAGTNPKVGVSVSCAAPGDCTAVGSYTESSGQSQGLVLSETSGTWAAGVEASLPANAGTNANAGLDSVSCASAGNCTAVGYYTDSSGHSQGLLLGGTAVNALALIGRPTSNGAGVTDKLICAPSALRPCQATETLTTTETTRGGQPVALSATARRKRRTVIVATKTVMIHPGRTVTVTVKLTATGRKLLARFGKLPVTLTITLLQNGRHLAIANTKLTVKPKKK